MNTLLTTAFCALFKLSNVKTTAYSIAFKSASIFILVFILPLCLNAAKIAVGTYTGNGGTAQNISGLGFTPVAVLVQKVGSTTSFIATSTMGNKAKVNGSGALVSNYISAMGSGYFTVGTNSSDANTSSATYYYVAFAATAVTTGTFTGTGATQTITVGFNPYLVWAIPASSTWPNYSQMSMRGSTSNVFKMEGNGAVDWHKQYLGDYSATSFDVHEYASTTETYHYVAFGVGSTGFYTGTAVMHTETPTSPTLANPTFLIAKDQGIAPNATSWYKTSVMSGATSYTFGGASSTTQITALTADGFTLGTSTDANAWNSNTQWYAFGSADLLPVEMISFFGRKSREKVELDWQTASEMNSSYFEIQRSTDGVNFETIGVEDAAGFSNSLISYQFTDASAAKGMNYYRLKEVDTDGMFEYSDVVVVDFFTGNSLLQVSLYPNPMQDNAILSFDMPNEGRASVEVFDAIGRLVYSNEQVFAKGGNSLSLNDLAISTGNYFVRVIAQSALSETVQFSKK
ncbi:MAG: T9SS type A sorting domain-containing protein [Flavobacteriales bacterium]